jgi:hypothetical protein
MIIMQIQILTERKKHDGLDEYTKSQVRDVKCFIYDEDCFWFDYKGTRFGLPILEIIKMRIDSIKRIRKELAKMEHEERMRK